MEITFNQLSLQNIRDYTQYVKLFRKRNIKSLNFIGQSYVQICYCFIYFSQPIDFKITQRNKVLHHICLIKTS